MKTNFVHLILFIGMPEAFGIWFFTWKKKYILNLNTCVTQYTPPEHIYELKTVKTVVNQMSKLNV